MHLTEFIEMKNFRLEGKTLLPFVQSFLAVFDLHL